MIEIVTSDNVSIVSFSARSIGGISEIEQISAELQAYVRENQPMKMVVDFNGVGFFSSQMLGLLVDIWRRMKEYEGVILISGINPQLARVFKITNLDRIFQFYPDRDSAVAAAEEK